MELQPRPGSGITDLLDEELEHIFGFLTFAEVKSVRLVNKHWRQVATTLLRRSSKQIKVDRSVSECITKMGDGQFPVNRLEIHLGLDCDYVEETEICLANFPGICAWVKELTLSVDINSLPAVQVVGDMATFPTDCVYKVLTHFDLEVFQRTDLCQESWKGFTDFFRSILEKSPNLRELNVGYKRAWAWEQGAGKLAICPVIENLFPISNSVGTSKLSCINFLGVPLEKIDLAKWSTLNLKLRMLKLNVSCFSNTNGLLAEFLGTQTGTLKDLTLNLGRSDSETPVATFTFPRLEKLEQLQITCNDIYAKVTVTGIDYTRQFPCLKKLNLTNAPDNWGDFLGNDLLEPTNTVEELIFPWTLRNSVNLILNPVVTAAKVFTGLKKLEIYPDRDFTEAVYENMPNLEVLTFANSFEEFDDVITGLDGAVCGKFRGVMTETWIKKLQNVEGRSMARLQKLKTLKLSNCVYNDHLYISRLSLHVFKKMGSLKCLDLFEGWAETAERYSANENQRQFLEELRANFVVL